MALPNTFAAVTAATGAQLDANFNAVGKIGSIPCAVAGANAIVLTPTPGISPTIAAYSNYLQVSGVVASNNTGSVTIQVGALAALNGYQDSVTGPALLSGGELVAGNAFLAMYDSALNSGAGGFHIYASTDFAGGTISASLASVTNLLVGASAATVGRIVSGLGTLTFTVTPANQTQDQNIVVTGAQIRDVVAIGLGTVVPAGAGFTGFCGTIGTVTVRMLNPTAASIAAATMTVRAMAVGLTP